MQGCGRANLFSVFLNQYDVMSFRNTNICMVHKLLPASCLQIKHTGSKKKAQITYRASPNLGNCTLFLISTVKSLAALRRGTFSLQKKKKVN